MLGRCVASGSWDRLLPGEIASLDGSSSVFAVSQVDEELAGRCRDGDIHPSGPMCGAGGLRPGDEAATCERLALELPRGAFATSLLREALDATLPDAESD